MVAALRLDRSGSNPHEGSIPYTTTMFKVEYDKEVASTKKNKKRLKRVLRPEDFDTQGKANRWIKKHEWIYDLINPRVIDEKVKENPNSGNHTTDRPL